MYDTPIFLAIEQKQPEILKVLLDSGLYDVNFVNGYKYTALMWACCGGRGDIRCVKLLIDAGADINFTPGNWTALDWAKYNNFDDIVELLLQHGAIGIYPDES